MITWEGLEKGETGGGEKCVEKGGRHKGRKREKSFFSIFLQMNYSKTIWKQFFEIMVHPRSFMDQWNNVRRDLKISPIGTYKPRSPWRVLKEKERKKREKRSKRSPKGSVWGTGTADLRKQSSASLGYSSIFSGQVLVCLSTAHLCGNQQRAPSPSRPVDLLLGLQRRGLSFSPQMALV